MSANRMLAVWYMCVCAVQTIGVYQSRFRFFKDYTLTQGTRLKNVSSPFMTKALCASLCTVGCNSAILRLKTKTCITYVDRFYGSTTMWTASPDWYLIVRNEPIQFNGWTMVFRAQKNININMSSVWEDTGSNDDNPLSLNGCYRLDNLGNCRRHFRSYLLDTWSNIQQVRFVLFLNGSEVRYITFNGFSTTKDSWFNQSLVLSSTWTGLKTDNLVGYFRLKGLTSNKTVRRFNIRNDQQQDCSFYASYVTGVDFNGDVCAPEWNLITAYFPQFLYSLNTNSMAVFSKLPKAYGFADVLGVFVLF